MAVMRQGWTDDRLTTRIEAVNERLEFGFGRLNGRIDSLARASVYLAAVLSTIVVALFASRLFAY